MSNKIKLITVATLIALTGCNSKNHAPAMAPVIYQNSQTTYETSLPMMSDVSPAPMPAPIPSKRIVTKRANISVDVDSIDEAKNGLISIVEKSSGLIVNAHAYEKSYNASIKVPSKDLINVLDDIANLGDKTAQSISQNDVTNQFVDNEARLKNLLLFRAKMKALLERTSNIEEIVKIEKELRRVQIEIDSIQGRQNYLKDAVALTPIEVNFKEKRVYGPLGYIANGIWWVTKKLFIIK